MANKVLQENELLSKITLLKKRFVNADPDHQQQILDWEKEAKQKLILDNLTEHEGVQFVVSKWQEQIDEINSVLMQASSKELPDTERDVLLKVKDFYQSNINMFVAVKSDIASIESSIDENISSHE